VSFTRLKRSLERLPLKAPEWPTGSKGLMSYKGFAPTGEGGIEQIGELACGATGVKIEPSAY